MATKQQPKQRKPRKAAPKPDAARPKYGFITLFFIDIRAQRIVQGQVESINTIHKPIRNAEKKFEGVEMNHYYNLRTEVYEHNSSIHEDNLYTSHEAAAKVFGKNHTDYLK